MSQTHEDSDTKREFMERLEQRADDCLAREVTTIASQGQVVTAWQSQGVDVRQLPDDEQGILRISIGGGKTPVPLNYCTFRGNHSSCVDLLRLALRAMENPNDDSGY